LRISDFGMARAEERCANPIQSPAAAESDVDSIKAGSIEVGRTLDGVSGDSYDGCEGPQPSRIHRPRAIKSAILNSRHLC
jgi:hypothetical protein